jgi:hypothetical protein
MSDKTAAAAAAAAVRPVDAFLRSVGWIDGGDAGDGDAADDNGDAAGGGAQAQKKKKKKRGDGGATAASTTAVKASFETFDYTANAEANKAAATGRGRHARDSGVISGRNARLRRGDDGVSTATTVAPAVRGNDNGVGVDVASVEKSVFDPTGSITMRQERAVAEAATTDRRQRKRLKMRKAK